MTMRHFIYHIIVFNYLKGMVLTRQSVVVGEFHYTYTTGCGFRGECLPYNRI